MDNFSGGKMCDYAIIKGRKKIYLFIHKIMENEIFSSRDLGLCSTLLALGHAFENWDEQLEGSGAKPVAYFKFKNTEELRDDSEKYWRKELQISPDLLLEASHRLKGIISGREIGQTSKGKYKIENPSRNLSFVSAMLSKGFGPGTIEWKKDSKNTEIAYFNFEGDGVKEAIKNYEDGKMTCEPQSFYSSFRAIKGMLSNFTKNPARITE